MTYAGAKVLVTGGLGFIGSSLARELVARGAKVTLVDSLHAEYGGNRWNLAGLEQDVSVHIADIRTPGVMEELLPGQDHLFNLAAQTSHVGSMQEPHVDLAINGDAQLTILEACRRLNPEVRIVYTSTRQLYGRPKYLPVDEAHPIRPTDVNGVSKLAGEQFHILYNDVYGIRACVLRLTNTYGPRMRVKDARQTFVGIWIRRLLEKLTIPVFGDGAQLRDFVYVDDCVQALLLAGSNEAAYGKTFNIGGDEPVSLLEVARLLVSLGYGGEIEMMPFPPERKAIDIGDYYSNSEAFTAAVQWKPVFDLRAGLRATVEYYRENIGHYL